MILKICFLLNIQEKLNHLPKTDKTSLHTAVKCDKKLRTITSKKDDTSSPSQESCFYKRLKYVKDKLMRLNEALQILVMNIPSDNDGFFANEDGNPVEPTSKTSSRDILKMEMEMEIPSS
ncbi:hypothetical protein Tco_0625320 [Tanacetum coccineum]|uniref:Uncharacterized protein n=1 Tax=Tanacetum coccineum TaxID=301880 RepID=A0ABQ4WGG3_9ASTR